MSNFNLSPDKMNLLLKYAGKQLGQDPEDLKARLEQGDAQSLMANLDAASQEKVARTLQDPKALELLMQNEQIQALMKKITGSK